MKRVIDTSVYGWMVEEPEVAKVMLSSIAVATYRTVNKAYGMSNPTFKIYRNFRQELLQSKNQEERPL